MISSITRQIGAEAHTFKLGNRAMRAMEGRFKTGLPTLLGRMQSDPDSEVITILTAILAEASNDGKGAAMEFADEIIDDHGFEFVRQIIEDLQEAAFPEAAAEAQGESAKNVTGAALVS